MPVPDRQRATINRAVSNAFDSCLGWMSSKAFVTEENKSIWGDKLYSSLFGSETPFTYKVSYSEKAQPYKSWFDGVVAPLKPTAIHVQFSFMLRPSCEDKEDIPVGVKLVLPLKQVRDRAEPWLTRRDGNPQPYLQFERYRGHLSGLGHEETHTHIIPKMREIYGQEVLDNINKIVSFYDTFYKVEDRLNEFTLKCKSLGAVFYHLPILHSFCPDLSQAAKHISFPRNSEPPDASLKHHLNSLFTIEQARRASTGAGEEE